MREGAGNAFGKLILLGEHAVVYGVPALVLGIGLRCDATAREGGTGRTISLLDGVTEADPSGDELARAFAALLDEGGAPASLRVEVRGDLPPGVGLGFSAAAAVAAARAVGALVGEAGDDAVRARAMAWERVFHGNPSGVDVAAAMTGGCTRFVRTGSSVPGVRGVPAVESRLVRVGAPFVLCVGLTGVRSSTKVMVEGLAALRAREPAMVDGSLEAVAALVENAVTAVEDGNAVALGELMNMNQMVLAGLMLSTSGIEELCSAARAAGALGAKLTGSGGGGAVVALADGERVGQAVVDAWRQLGYSGFMTTLSTHRMATPRMATPKPRTGAP